MIICIIAFVVVFVADESVIVAVVVEVNTNGVNVPFADMIVFIVIGCLRSVTFISDGGAILNL